MKMRGKLLASLAAAAALLGAVVLVVPALAGAVTPAPAITSGPNGPTGSSSVTFHFGDSASGAILYTCSLDGGLFLPCPGTATYDLLVDGAHTFSVKAKALLAAQSAAATQAFSVDTQPPAVQVSFPPANSTVGVAGWGAGCVPPGKSGSPGICGTAGDSTGVGQVAVTLQQKSTGDYWNGSSFVPSAKPISVAATGTTSWSLPIAITLLPAGSYGLSVAATDSLGHVTVGLRLVTFSFGITLSLPPAPVITQHPADPTLSSSASFRFADLEPLVSFQCQLDAAGYSPCPHVDSSLDLAVALGLGPKLGLQVTLSLGLGCLPTLCAVGDMAYSHLGPGRHCFDVEAVDILGLVSSPAEFCWTINSVSFGISGDVPQLLYPGMPPQSIDLSFTNPNSVAIVVTAVTITVGPAMHVGGGPNPACGPENLNVVRSFSGTVTVPANSTKSLSQLGTPAAQWPQIQMPDLPVNQDACENTTFPLNYAGSAYAS